MKQNVASNRPLWVGLLCGKRISQWSACDCASHSEGGIDRPAGTAIAAATVSGLQSVQSARIDRGSAPHLVPAGLHDFLEELQIKHRAARSSVRGGSARS